MLVGGIGQVLADVCAVGDAFGPGPRLTRETEGEDRAVRTHAGIPEQVPGAADALPAFQDGVADARVAFGDAVCRAEAGDSRADDQDIEVLGVGLEVGWNCSD